ncbi:hypothetical protein [Actinomadura sediminis]|uniref:DUF998 domain-containing protein n=1 Tax=Actinomadura sediminis TaxID=1038904 RepID=A0ABW3EYA1_9ACTN
MNVERSGLPPLPRRMALVVALLLLSPICAEYLIGYDQIIGRPLVLLGGLLILAPLYGTVAVLIREAARRTGRGWPTIVLLGAAFGLVQAGLIDQSLFNPDFVDEPSWDRDRLPTHIPELGLSAKYLLSFVAGHVIWSFGAPIAVIEACAPRYAKRPWLGRTGIATMVVLYGLGAAIICREHTEDFMASPAQLGTTAAIAVLLGIAAFAIPRRSGPVSGRVPPPWAVGCGAVVLWGTHQLAPASWAGVALSALALTLAAGCLLRYAGRRGWNHRHLLAAGGAALVVNSALAFVVEPLGETSYPVKYAVNTVFLLGVLLLLGLIDHRLRRSKETVAQVGRS